MSDWRYIGQDWRGNPLKAKPFPKTVVVVCEHEDGTFVQIELPKLALLKLMEIKPTDEAP